MPPGWYVLPFIAAAIGWFTNFIAVRMIFRPHRRIKILGVPIQGLLPKRKTEFAKSIGQTVEEHLISSDDIKKVLEDPKAKARIDENLDLREIVTQKIIDFDMRKLETIVLAVAKKELRGIEILGAILGFVVGCAQIGLMVAMG